MTDVGMIKHGSDATRALIESGVGGTQEQIVLYAGWFVATDFQ